MGARMRGFLEYREGDRWESLDRGWDLARSSTIYMMLSDLYGGNQLYPPRGVPRDAETQVLWDYLHEVVATKAETQRSSIYTSIVDTRRNAKHYVTSGYSEWWQIDGVEGVDFVSNPEYRGASWLTTAEFRHVIDHYDANIDRILREEWSISSMESVLNEYGEREHRYEERSLTEDEIRERTPLHASFRMLLAAMETGEACGKAVRLIFWFHG